jgi:lysozyme family protein
MIVITETAHSWPKDPHQRANRSHWRATSPNAKATSGSHEAKSIHHATCWNTVRGGELPGGIGLVVFDISVNSGQGRTMQMLQSAVRCNQVDGIFGPATMAAVVTMSASGIVSASARARRRFYAGLVQRDPTQEPFLAGWLNRVAATTAAARRMVC